MGVYPSSSVTLYHAASGLVTTSSLSAVVSTNRWPANLYWYPEEPSVLLNAGSWDGLLSLLVSVYFGEYGWNALPTANDKLKSDQTWNPL